MPKRKLSHDNIVTNILNFVNSDDDKDFNYDSDDLNELYDEPDWDADGDSSGDSSDSSDENDTEARSPCKVFTCKQLVNSLDKSFDLSCYDSHDSGTTDSIPDENVLVGYVGPKKNLKSWKIQWTNFSHQQSVLNQSLLKEQI